MKALQTARDCALASGIAAKAPCEVRMPPDAVTDV